MNYCSNCGVLMPPPDPDGAHPHCPECNTTHWQNPKPVVILLQPVQMHGSFDGSGMGLLIQKRAIEPGKGGWAMPSGFVEEGESFLEAAAREFNEECGCPSAVTPATMAILGDHPNTAGTQSLVFIQNNMRLMHEDLADLKVTPEVDAWDIRGLRAGHDLCFSQHEKVANHWLKHHEWRATPDQLLPSNFKWA